MMRKLGLLTLVATLSIPAIVNAAEIDWKKVDAALGKTAAVSGEVHRYGLPRSDLHVTLDGVAIKPALALGGWVAFAPVHGEAMVMGDLVLLETEITPVMTKLLDGGLDITAVHNHILRASPATFYMHIGGHGDATKLATAVKEALALTKVPAPKPPATAQQDIGIDTAGIEQALGAKGKINGGVFQVGVPRAESITEGGMKVPNSMGLATALNFQPTGGGKAAITGDFVLIGSEVNPVIQALRSNGIEVTAVHSHMLDEEPRLFFMHFWANDDAVKLAKGLRAAVDKTNSQKGK